MSSSLTLGLAPGFHVHIDHQTALETMKTNGLSVLVELPQSEPVTLIPGQVLAIDTWNSGFDLTNPRLFNPDLSLAEQTCFLTFA